MADRIAIASGNLTTAGTWGVPDATGSLVSTSTGSDALSTSAKDSAAFTPGAITVIGIALRLASRAAGSPTNTVTVTLRNSTAGADVISVVANVSNLPQSDTTTDNGGWHFFKFSTPQLLLAATNYLVRVLMNSTSTAVSLYTNGTTNNWQRLLVTDGTGAPGAGDNMFICQTLDGATNPATQADITVTMDSTAATDYGSANTNYRIPAVNLSKGGTLIFGVAAATNYILRCSGWIHIGRAGTFSMGTSGAEMPRDSTAEMQFDCGADGDFGMVASNGGIINMYGLSRTVGKNVTWTYLTSDVAASGGSPQTVNVFHDTGWLSGDDIIFAPTSRTYTAADARTLNANAGASSLQITTQVTNAHQGTAPVQGEVGLLTRNVRFKAVNSSFMTFLSLHAESVFNAQWTEFRYIGVDNVAGKRGIETATTTAGVFNLLFCSIRECDASAIWITSSTFPGVMTDNVMYAAGRWIFGTVRWEISGAGTWNFSRNLMVSHTSQGFTLGQIVFSGGTLTSTTTFQDNRITGSGGHSIRGDCTLSGVSTTWSGNHLHSGNDTGCYFGAMINSTFTDWKIYRNVNQGFGILANQIHQNNIFTTCYFFGNSGNGFAVLDSVFCKGVFNSCIFGSDTSFGQGAGFIQSNGIGADITFNSCDFGVASGILSAHTSGDISGNNTSTYWDLLFRNTRLASTNEYVNFGSVRAASRGRHQRHDQTAGNDFTYKWVAGGVRGISAKNSTTVNISGYSEQLTAPSASFKVPSAPRRIRVNNGDTVSVSVYVRKNAAYNGNAPRLIMRANPAIGVAADVVAATFSAGADTWQQLSYTSPAANADGEFEFIVDCDGTAGNVFVADWVNGDDQHWFNGEPDPSLVATSGGGGGGTQAVEHSFVF